MRRDVRFGSKADIGLDQRHVRFTPKSGHSVERLECPLCAKNGLMQRSKKDRYSMSSSARARIDVGTTIPKLLAVFRLITSSNLVGNSAGSSLGLVPFNILAASDAP